MTIINHFMAATASTAIALTLGSQPALSLNTQSKAETYAQLPHTPTHLIQQSSVIAEANNILEVQNSEISMPIPQPIALSFFLAMAGLGGFFKLKIVHTKLKHNTGDS